MEATASRIKKSLKRLPIDFIEMTHSYIHNKKKGLELEGITSTLIKYAYPDAYKTPDYMSEEQWEETLANAAVKGTEVHRDIQNYCENCTLPSTPEGRSWMEMEQEHKIEWIENEYLVSDNKNFASQIDIVALVNGELSIIDIKRTSELHYDTVTLQTSIYKMWFDKMNPSMTARHCYVFWAREDKWKLVELAIIKPEEIKKLTKAYLTNDTEFVFNPLPTWCRGGSLAYITKLIRQQKTIEAELKTVKEHLRTNMEAFHNKGFQYEGTRITYIAPTTAKTFDMTKFKNDYPELYEQYLKESVKDSSVRLSVK